ncbi:erythromycin esterase family protein [Arthrospiribacter ruber]|nr:erythromycin esterase family protein [Arthrospiribacter ruber]
MTIVDDFEELSIIDKWVKDKEIVFLGEPTHGDGSIFSARIKIIKHLVEKHGFDAVIFESNGYDAFFINELRKTGQISLDDFRQSTFSIWGNTEELQELWEFLLENEHVEFLGMDHYPHNLMKIQFLADMKQEIKLSKEEIQLIQPMVDSIATTELLPRRYYLDSLELAMLGNLKSRLKNSTPSLRLQEGVDNLIHFSAFESQDHLQGQFWPKFNYRDSLMFESLKRHTKIHKKVIVWLASAHGLENPSSIIDPDDLREIGQTYSDMVTLGKLAKSHFGDKMLNLVFSAYSGSFYDFIDKKEIEFRLDSVPNLEKYVIEKNKSITLVDLRKIDSVFFSGILGFEYIQANWGKNFDGVFIIPEVKASKRLD